MADPNDLLEQLRLVRLKLLQDEQQRKETELNSGKFDYTPADVYPGRISPLKHIIPQKNEGYILDGDDIDTWNSDQFSPKGRVDRKLTRDWLDAREEEKELEQLPFRFQNLFTPIKGNK